LAINSSLNRTFLAEFRRSEEADVRSGTSRRGRIHVLGGSCFAWIAGSAGWGHSNAGLVVGERTSLLVDTLFDLELTAAMLAAMSGLTAARPVTTVVNTHANGDHYFGNQLVAGSEIIASASAATQMTQADVEQIRSELAEPGPAGDYIRELFGGFSFDGIAVTGPTRTFRGHLDVDVSGVEVVLIEAGPAHTDGDVIVHVPSARTAFVGDLLFSGSTPVAWAGPLSGWVRACDLLLDLDLRTVVPGHGPVTGKDGVREVRDYLVHVDQAATRSFAEGRSLDETVASIELGRFAAWSEPGRVVQNVISVYRHLDPQFRPPPLLQVMARMGRYERRALAACPPMAPSWPARKDSTRCAG
jgi:glyoxylase-like metal-dependent hydrolase (beta-lactamase superfamily II)